MTVAFQASETAWALRAYLVLIGCADRNETITYEDLAKKIKRGGSNLLSEPLRYLTSWCAKNGTPHLAALVVEKTTGMPAPGFKAVDRGEIHNEQERAWRWDWFAHYPPTVEQMKEAVN